MIKHSRLRVYALQGTSRSLLWCRDRNATWQRELREKRPAEKLSGQTIPLPGLSPGAVVRAYDPWSDRWSRLEPDGEKLPLPPITRSVVIRIDPSR